MGRHSLREQLLNSGVSTVHERGFVASGIRDITAAAGIPLGSFTNHFRSKEDFGIAVLDRYVERVEALFDATLRDESRPPVERLRAYFDAVTALLAGAGWRHGCLIGNLSLEATEHSELIRARLSEVFGSLTRSFAAAVRAAQEAGQARTDLDAEDMAAVLLSAWQGAMLQMKVVRGPEPLDRFRRVLFAALLAAPAGVRTEGNP